MYFKFLPNVEMRRSLTVNHQMSSKAKGREYQPHMYPNLHHMRISSLSKKLPTLLLTSCHISENILLSDDGERSGLWLHSEDCSALSEPFHSLLPQILDHHHYHHYHLHYVKIIWVQLKLFFLCFVSDHWRSLSWPTKMLQSESSACQDVGPEDEGVQVPKRCAHYDQ